MDWTAVALADLRLSLKVASSAYVRFTEHPEIRADRDLLRELSVERGRDADSIDRATVSADLELADPMLDERSAAKMLGLSRSNPTSPATIAFQVQRSENRLASVASQLGTVTEHPALRTVLGMVHQHIEDRREDVRAMRRAARFERPDALRTFSASMPQIEGNELMVWFGTNRALDGKGKFIGARGDEVRYGQCKVFVPTDREIGSLGSGWLRRLIRGDDRVKLTGTIHLSSADFWSGIAREFSSIEPPDRHALVFLHGYCVKFDDAARRTAQLKADLGFRGLTAFFSWPSLGAELGYTGDVAAIQASESAIREFLVNFAVQSGAGAVHIIAHSMGNQGLLRAMDAIARDAAAVSRVRFGQIILAAPDVDRELFADLASAYVALAQRSTLYISENDFPIGMSAWLHRYDRVGRAPPVTIVPGIDTVNVSKVNLGMFAHSYVAEMRPILGDIHQLLNGNTPPEKRFGLLEAGGPNARHWVFAA